MEIYSTKVYTNKELESMVPFYDTTPNGDVNIQELEQWSYDRLKVLRKIDTMKTLGKIGEAFDKEITEHMNKYMPINNDGAIMKDDVSHHLLRLAFHKEPQRRWFINQERILFETRLKTSDPEKLMRKHNLSIEKVSEREMTQYKEQLAYLSANSNDTFYKVDFRKAGQLMASHNTFLIGKMAYISKKSLIKIAIYEFEKHLEKQLEIVNKAQIYFENDEQISPMLKNFAQNYCMDIIDTRKGVKKTGKDLDLTDIEELYEKSFPLCMKKLHLSLKKKHHLTHQGRMQYGLFLKGIGVSLENSINLWRSEFLKNPTIDSNLFDKKYLYGIKHHYGKAGKGTDYASYGCAKIINSVPGSRDDHGCPFRNSTPEQLVQDFKSVGIEMYQGNQIVQLLKGNHYQLACKKYFDLTHPGHTQDLTVTHPSVFFFSSTEHLKQKEKSKDKGLLKK